MFVFFEYEALKVKPVHDYKSLRVQSRAAGNSTTEEPFNSRFNVQPHTHSQSDNHSRVRTGPHRRERLPARRNAAGKVNS